MADFDLGGTISGIFDNLAKAGIQYVTQQQQVKQAKKLAKAMNAGGAGFPMLGTGNMQFQSPGYGYGLGYQYPAPIGPVQPQGAGMGDLVESIMNPDVYRTLRAGYDVVTGGSTSAPGVRRPSIIQGPDGRLYRTIGRPLLWSGDLAAFKRVRKIAGKLRSYAGHRGRFR